MTQPALIPGRRPTHRLYRAIGDGDTAIWTAIGAAWPNKDGRGSASAAMPCRFKGGS